MYLSPEAARAAKAILDKTVDDLAEAIGLSRPVILNIMNGTGSPSQTSMMKAVNYFNEQDILIKEHGAERAPAIIKIKGCDGFRSLYNQIYDQLKREGGFLYIQNGDSTAFTGALGEDFLKMHIKRMVGIKDQIDVRAITTPGDRLGFGTSYAEYKSIPEKYFTYQTKFIYKNKVAFVTLNGDLTEGRVYRDKDLADSEKKTYEMIWQEMAKEYE